MKPQALPPVASLKWTKSSYSGNSGNCIEVAPLPDNTRALRDSKAPSGPILTFPTPAWTAFLRSL